MDKYDLLTKELLEWGARNTGPNEYSQIRTTEFAQRYQMPEFDVEQLLEQMSGKNWIDLRAWDGQRSRPFKEWQDARSFWNSTEDGGYRRIKTLIEGKKRLSELDKQLHDESAGKEGVRATSLAEALKSTPLPPVDDIAGLVLEELVKIGQDENVGNFAARFTGRPALEARTPATSIIYEAFSRLQSLNMIAPARQGGWYFVTSQGQQIGTAVNLRAFLAKQQGGSGLASSEQIDVARDTNRQQDEPPFRPQEEDSTIDAPHEDSDRDDDRDRNKDRERDGDRDRDRDRE